jgi:uncharacterized transporter YbjL
MHRKWIMSDIALTVSVLALVAVVGLWIGNIKIRGVGFGIGGVLFGGIFVGHFADQLGLVLSAEMLHFVQEFGLILFVYTIGIQVGPGFFASLRVSGLRLNLFALGIVVMGGWSPPFCINSLIFRSLWCWGFSPARSPTRLRLVRGSKFCAIWVSPHSSTRWG